MPNIDEDGERPNIGEDGGAPASHTPRTVNQFVKTGKVEMG